MIERLFSLLYAGLTNGLFINDREAVVIWVASSTLTDLFIKSCSTSSYTLLILSVGCCLQALQVRHLLHLYVISLPVFSTSSNIFCFLTSKFCGASASSTVLTWHILSTLSFVWLFLNFTCNIDAAGFTWNLAWKVYMWCVARCGSICTI